MKILIVTPHFYPENFKCNDMAFELRNRGHDVTVMTAIPDYPEGRFFDGYGILKKRREKINGVDVRRSLIIPRGNGSSFRIAINYLSYTLFATLKSLWIGLTNKYDVIIGHETSPIMVGIPGVIVKRIQKIPMVFWVLDLWPESLTAAGGITNKKIIKPFERLTKWIYRYSDRLLIGSKGYRSSINQKGDFDFKIQYFPNWIEESLANSKTYEVPKLPDGFNVMIAGNMGDAQDIPHIMDAALHLRGQKINFIFVGDGRKKDFVEDFVKQNSLEQQVFCIGRFPLEAMPSLFAQASVLFMALKDVSIFSLTVPSRLQAYMSSGKPVVAMINGEGADLINEADCGWSVPAEDSKALSELLLKLSKEDKIILDRKGENGKLFAEKHFNFKKCMDNLESIIQDSVSTPSS
ncbi:MAG: glycosyltransferase family 4 protein [Muribaculaceae bacterium]|nr:glycosyltransferase family 4 protein [Muribaculaceae bacterium]